MLYTHLIAHSTDTGRLLTARLSQPGPVFKCLGVLKKEETKLKHIALGVMTVILYSLCFNIINNQLCLFKRTMHSTSLSPFDCIVTSPFFFSRQRGAVSAAFCLRLVYYVNPPWRKKWIQSAFHLFYEEWSIFPQRDRMGAPLVSWTSMWTYLLCSKLTKVFQISEIRSLVKSACFALLTLRVQFLIFFCDSF